MLFKKTTSLINDLVIAAALSLLSAPLMAADANETRTSKSISFKQSTELDEAEKDVQLEQTEADIISALSETGFRQESTAMALELVTSPANNSGDITLYDASTELISDFDYDGFYHRFSVSIDVDTIFATSYIYARLYLSYEGGPWNLYASSDNYHIHSDSELDSFTIETELAEGFPPGYYDVRIEIYNADYDDWLLSYGPYDDASLSALPLEDSYQDDAPGSTVSLAGTTIETDVVIAGHGSGSMSWWLLLLPALTVVVRRFSKVKTLN